VTERGKPPARRQSRVIGRGSSAAAREEEPKDPGEIRKGLPEDWAAVSRGPETIELPGGWRRLMLRYAGMGRSKPLDRIFKHTLGRENPTQVQLESGYIDEDFRDEYANFYAKTYRELPTRCERLHFFDTRDKEERRYLGYVILRPIVGRPVSRTMLGPPKGLAPHVSCLTVGRASAWGYPLSVNGFPFISQDEQLGSCAHAAIWMVALYFHLRFARPRYHLSDLAKSARLHQDVHPALPSAGLTGRQISAVLHDLEMTPMIYRIDDDLPDAAESIACRYLNSGLPVILLNETPQAGHAKVLIGYGRDEKGLFFVHHDDQRGPYRKARALVGRLPEATHRGGLNALVVPMPGRIYLSGEAAERWGRLVFEKLIEDFKLGDLAGGLEAGRLRLRCYVIESAAYMRALRTRAPVEDVVQWHTGIAASHWLWVVELQNREAAMASPACVLGEVAIDATSDDNWVNPLFGNLPGVTFEWPSLGEEIEWEESAQDGTPYRTGCALHVSS
jgi:hypothetical protein